MYQFNFGSLLKNRSVCVNKESRFTVIPEHIHSVIEFLYVYSGHCTQIINGQSIQMAQGDICMLDTHVPHSIQPLGKNDIVITIEMKKEYLTQGFLQRLGNNGIINGFLINALSSEAAHDQYLLFHNREETPIHAVIQSILCESYDPQICGDKNDRCLYDRAVLQNSSTVPQSELFAKGQKPVEDRGYSGLSGSKLSNRHLAEHRRPFGFHPNYLSAFIKRETGRTFKELVILQKMCQACFYLTNTDFPIYEIAQKVGYDNLGFFYRKFTELYHMTPQEFRERKAYA